MNGEKKHIFIGGWTHTGTRVICQILKQKGYAIIGPHNEVFDYRGENFRVLYNFFCNNGDETLFNVLKNDVQKCGSDKWVVKHGHFIMHPDKIREYFPDAFIVCCVRDILDILSRGPDNNYLEFKDPTNKDTSMSIQNRVNTMSYWYRNLGKFDHLIRLEDLLYTKRETIEKLFQSLHLSDPTANDAILNIVGKPRPTVNKGQELVSKMGNESFHSVMELGRRFNYYKPKITVICHYFNEEYLLPFWLDHHKNIFSHGIMIDYNSTDKSNDIVKSIVPGWELIQSRNKYFSAEGCDSEVVDLEKQIQDGWKIALNVTEFIVGRLDDIICRMDGIKSDVARLKCIPMVDSPKDEFRDIDSGKPLIAQRTHGIKDAIFRKHRIVHKLDHGHYTVGRHTTMHPIVSNISRSDCCVLWYGFSPFNVRSVARKLQIQTKIPFDDPHKGFGLGHITDDNKLMKEFKKHQTLTHDLATDPEMKHLFAN